MILRRAPPSLFGDPAVAKSTPLHARCRRRPLTPRIAPQQVKECPFEAVYPAEENQQIQDDNCALMYLNEGTLLYNLKQRYMQDKIYTFTAGARLSIAPSQKRCQSTSTPC